MLKKATLLALAAIPAAAAAQETGDWKVTLGAGVGVGPEYEGARTYQVQGVPLVEIGWRDRIRLTTLDYGPALYVAPFRWDSGGIEVGVRYEGEREEKESKVLKGLGDLDTGAIAVVRGAQRLGPASLMGLVSRDIGGDRDGTTVTAGADVTLVDTEGFGFSVGGRATWADARYMQAQFGITPQQAARSALKLPAYEADAGFKNVEARVTAALKVAEQWTLIGVAGYSRLLGDAADSPIVADYGRANQLQGAVALTYSF